jgi:hypothetical protein
MSGFLASIRFDTAASVGSLIWSASVTLPGTVTFYETVTLNESVFSSERVEGSILESELPFYSTANWRSRVSSRIITSSDGSEARVGTTGAIIGGIFGGLLVLIISAIVVVVVVGKKCVQGATDENNVDMDADVAETISAFGDGELYVSEEGLSDGGHQADIMSGVDHISEEG